MMPAATRHHRLFSRPWCRKTRSGSFSVDLESLARFQLRPGSSPRRLSARFGLRLAPAKTQQKSGGHPSDRSGRQFAAPPPAGNLLTIGLGQIAQDPQEPKGCRGDLDPNLNTAFGGQAVELSTGGAQLGFQESDAMFNAEAFVVDRFGLTRRRRRGLLRRWDEDQPERTSVTLLARSLVFDDAIEVEPLLEAIASSAHLPNG
jgi:hypothetical protein